MKAQFCLKKGYWDLRYLLNYFSAQSNAGLKCIYWTSNILTCLFKKLIDLHRWLAACNKKPERQGKGKKKNKTKKTRLRHKETVCFTHRNKTINIKDLSKHCIVESQCQSYCCCQSCWNWGNTAGGNPAHVEPQQMCADRKRGKVLFFFYLLMGPSWCTQLFRVCFFSAICSH